MRRLRERLIILSLLTVVAGCAKSPVLDPGAGQAAVRRTPAYTVFFDLDSAAITPDAAATLDRAIGEHRPFNARRLIISGHADRSGSERHNRLLSEQRAEAVRRYLIDAGVSPDAVVTEAHGEEQGLVGTPDGTVEPQNRRVEIFILSTDGNA